MHRVIVPALAALPSVAGAAADASCAVKLLLPETAPTPPDRPRSGIHETPRVMTIGISAAPFGEADDASASAGIQAIADTIEF